MVNFSFDVQKAMFHLLLDIKAKDFFELSTFCKICKFSNLNAFCSECDVNATIKDIASKKSFNEEEKESSNIGECGDPHCGANCSTCSYSEAEVLNTT